MFSRERVELRRQPKERTTCKGPYHKEGKGPISVARRHIEDPQETGSQGRERRALGRNRVALHAPEGLSRFTRTPGRDRGGKGAFRKEGTGRGAHWKSLLVRELVPKRLCGFLLKDGKRR